MASAGTDERTLVRGASIRYRFRNDNFDFWLRWIPGAQTHGGSESGECFHAVAQINDGSPDSWMRAWSDLGARVEERADAVLARGQIINAREAHLRAHTYHRFARLYLSVKDPGYQPLWHRSARRFRAGVTRLDTPVQAVAIPYRGATLPGCFLRPDDGPRRRKKLIMVGGGDTFGISGGYWAPRATAHEPHLNACVASSAIPDVHEYLTPGDPKAKRNARKLDAPLHRPMPRLMGRRLRAQLIQFFGCRPVGPVGRATGLAASGIGTAGGLAASQIAERVWPDSDGPDGGEPVAQKPLDEPEPSTADSTPSRTRRGEEQP